jgi:CspA family cold shock protein
MTFRNSMGENCSYRGLLSGKISSQSRLLNGFLGFADWDQRLDEGGAMKTGLVKWFNAWKGYGFIRPVDGGFDVYVHINEVRRAGWAELKEGQEICFETVVDERTGEIIAENLSVPPTAPARTSVPVGRKAS